MISWQAARKKSTVTGDWRNYLPGLGKEYWRSALEPVIAWYLWHEQ
jgi:hypothetical protein